MWNDSGVFTIKLNYHFQTIIGLNNKFLILYRWWLTTKVKFLGYSNKHIYFICIWEMAYSDKNT